MRCRLVSLWSTLATRGSRYCGVVTTRSQPSSFAQGRPRWTTRTRCGAWLRIQRAIGSLRRPAVMIRSGQGGASVLERLLSMPTSQEENGQLTSTS